jgi:hypothetical protein
MPGIAPPAKTYRTATTADYADEFSCCGRAFDFDRYHLRHFEVFSALPFNMTWGQHAGRSPMIARGDQIVANCTAGGAQAADVRHGERRIGRTDQSPSFACLASH